MFWLWMIFCLLFSCLLEVLLGLHGLALPVLLSVVFYFACLLPWHRGALFYFVAAALLDSWFARSLPSTGLSLLGVLYFARAWKRFGDVNSLFALLVPGALLGLIAKGFILLNVVVSGGGVTVTNLICAVIYCLCSIGLLPAVFYLLEKTARRLALRRMELFSSISRLEEYSAREGLLDG